MQSFTLSDTVGVIPDENRRNIGGVKRLQFKGKNEGGKDVDGKPLRCAYLAVKRREMRQTQSFLCEVLQRE